MASSSPSKASRKAAKRASEIKQGKQREFAEEVPEVAAAEQQAQAGNDATAVPALEHKSSNGKMWPYIRLSESTGATRSLPAVFSKDGRCVCGTTQDVYWLSNIIADSVSWPLEQA